MYGVEKLASGWRSGMRISPPAQAGSVRLLGGMMESWVVISEVALGAAGRGSEVRVEESS